MSCLLLCAATNKSTMWWICHNVCLFKIQRRSKSVNQVARKSVLSLPSGWLLQHVRDRPLPARDMLSRARGACLCWSWEGTSEDIRRHTGWYWIYRTTLRWISSIAAKTGGATALLRPLRLDLRLSAGSSLDLESLIASLGYCLS